MAEIFLDLCWKGFEKVLMDSTGMTVSEFIAQHTKNMTLETKIAALIEYLKVKTEERDWHAVSDAANDLRVLEAQNNATKALNTAKL